MIDLDNDVPEDDGSSAHITPKKRIAVIGAGSFGTSLATVAARNGHDVVIYARNQSVCDGINNLHINNQYLSEFELLPNITATSNAVEALTNSDLVILALPAQVIPSFLEEYKHIINPDTLLCNSAKGLYLQGNCLLSEAIRRALGREQPYTVISGPSFAREIMLNRPTAVVCASKYLYHAVTVQRLLSSNYFKVFTSQDVLGVELGGALKNPLAIGAGIIEGLQLGINTLSFYLTRCSIELMSLCRAMGGDPATISGLAGIGDLMLTAFGDLSRNRACGIRLARGESIQSISASTTVEGIASAKVAVAYADACGLGLPIFRTVAAILDGKMTIPQAQEHLMGLRLSREKVER